MIQPKIYIATHKQIDQFPCDENYIPIHVGRSLSETDLGIIGDDTGVNISSLNPFFSECTALYWILHNDCSDIVGLSHYRRYFAPREKSIDILGKSIAASTDFSELDDKADLIVVNSESCFHNNNPLSLELHYCNYHYSSDFFMTRRVVREIANTYIDAFDFTARINRFSPFNMFVGKRDVVRRYLEWLFRILFRLKDMIPYNTYDPYQARVFGFLAERLFNVWINHHWGDYKISYRGFVTIE